MTSFCYALLVEDYDCYLLKKSLIYAGEYQSDLLTQFRTLRDAQDTVAALNQITLKSSRYCIMLLLPAINVMAYFDVSAYFFKNKSIS